jgi:hypothetical protein
MTEPRALASGKEPVDDLLSKTKYLNKATQGRDEK